MQDQQKRHCGSILWAKTEKITLFNWDIRMDEFKRVILEINKNWQSVIF